MFAWLLGRRARPWLYGLAILTGILTLALVAARVYVARAVRNFTTPADWAEIERFLETPYPIPEAWTQPRTFSPELVKADEAFLRVAVVDAVEVNRFVQLFLRFVAGKPLSGKDWDDLREAILANATWLDPWESYVSRPDFDMGALGCSTPGGGPNLLSWQVAGRGEYLVGAYLVHVGDASGALRSALYLLAGSRRIVPTLGIVHGTISEELRMAVDTAVVALRACSDTTVLRPALREWLSMPPPDPPQGWQGLLVEEAAAGVRAWQELGSPMPPGASRTGRQVARRSIDFFLYVEVIPSATDPDVVVEWRDHRGSILGRYRQIHRQVQTWVQILGWREFVGHGRERAAWLGVVAEALGMPGTSEEAWVIWQRDLMDALFGGAPLEVTMRMERAKYDLVALAMAARIDALEGRPRARDMNALAPRYFATPLMDPFSGKPYPYSATAEAFYSVGPDGKDDGGGRIGDDIVLKR